MTNMRNDMLNGEKGLSNASVLYAKRCFYLQSYGLLFAGIYFGKVEIYDDHLMVGASNRIPYGEIDSIRARTFVWQLVVTVARKDAGKIHLVSSDSELFRTTDLALGAFNASQTD